MTIRHMQRWIIVTVAAMVVTVGLDPLHAQFGPAASTIVKAAAPTGPMSAATRDAITIRASRTVAESARQAGSAVTAGGAVKTSAVKGFLWTANDSPVSNATVQLRNTVTGEVEMYTKTSEIGEYAFGNVDAGSYVIEYTNNVSANAVQTAVGAATKATDVVALSQPFNVAAGQTIDTFVRAVNNLGNLLPSVSSNVSNAAIQDAISVGVTQVLAPNVVVVETASPVH